VIVCSISMDLWPTCLVFLDATLPQYLDGCIWTIVLFMECVDQASEMCYSCHDYQQVEYLMRREEDIKSAGPYSLGNSGSIDGGANDIQSSLRNQPRETNRSIQVLEAKNHQSMQDRNHGGQAHSDKQCCS
jgi:hypothetical protein